MRTRFLAIPLALLLALPATASPGLMKEEKKTLRDALGVLESLTIAPDKGIPQELLAKAHCILIFPSVAKGAFLTGGKSGRGVASCRQPDGGMGAAAFYLVGGASTGFEIEGMSADVVMLIMNPQGVDHLLTDRFTIGGEATASAGPVEAQVRSWSRSRGSFVVAVLDGSVVRANQDANARLYGEAIPGREILVGGKLAVPVEAKPFVDSIRTHMAAAVAQEKLEN
jgi:lipid-binding SYLF domain-containing protein